MKTPLPADPLQARAVRRVRRKVGFFIHAFVFLAVNLGLLALNLMTEGPRWHVFPLTGWSLGLAIHGLVTFLSLNDGWHDRMVAAEVQRLRQPQA